MIKQDIVLQFPIIVFGTFDTQNNVFSKKKLTNVYHCLHTMSFFLSSHFAAGLHPQHGNPLVMLVPFTGAATKTLSGTLLVIPLMIVYSVLTFEEFEEKSCS